MKRLYNFFLAFFPILSSYGFSPSVDFGSILLFLLGLGCLFFYPNQFKIRFPIGYSIFVVVTILLSLFWSWSVPLRLILFSINLCFACSFANLDQLWNYYSKVVWICVIFFIIQELCFLFFGSRPSGIVSFLPTIYGDNSNLKIEQIMLNNRSSSLFLEPSYFAQYLVPYLAISIMSMNKYNRRQALIISFILLLIRSGMGVLLLGIIWMIWLLFSEVNNRIKWSIVIGSLVLILILFFSGNSLFSFIISRSGEMMSYGGDEVFQSSGFIRFFRGYFAFADIPFLNKLLGSSPADVNVFLDNNIYFINDPSNFINGLQTMLFYHGLIGAILYIHHLLLFPIRSHNKILLILSISILFLMLGESFYLCSRLFLMIVLMDLIFCREKRRAYAFLSGEELLASQYIS